MRIPFVRYSFKERRFLYDAGKSLDVPGGGVAVEGENKEGKVKESAGTKAREMSGVVGEGLESQDGDERQKYSFEEFVRRFGEAAKDEKSKQEFSQWAAKQIDSELLRRGGVDSSLNAKDVLAKHVKLVAEYLNKIEDIDGHIVFEVNFKGNELAEWKIGAGHLLPATVAAIKVYDAEGKVLTQNAVRGIRDGRVGYFDSASGAYIPVHSGYRLEIVQFQEVKEESVSVRIKEGAELFDKDGKKIVIKDNLEKFFKDKKLDVKVDDNYSTGGIADLLEKLQEVDAEWWQKYLDGTFKYENFVELFDKIFSEEDLNFTINLCRLRDLQKAGQDEEKIPEDVFMSDFVRLKNDARFTDFKGGKLNDDQLYEFAKKGFEFGGDYSEAVGDNKEVGSRESFTLVDGKFWLREGAARALSSARAYARTLVPSVELKLNSAHRGIGSQKNIFANALKKYGSAKAARKWAALSGSSPHHTGGAIDIAAIVNGRGGVKHVNQRYLKQILPRFGFVNYSAEPWHWEIYIKRWQRLTGNSGPLYPSRLEKIDDSNASKLA